MVFKLKVSETVISPAKAEIYKSLGFTVTEHSHLENHIAINSMDLPTFDWGYDENKDLCPTIEINSMEELFSFYKKIGYPLIFSIRDDENRLEIYNGWRE